MKRKLIGMLLFVCLAAGGVHMALAGAASDVRSVLGGTVTWTVPVGTHVEEGSELVRISTLTGSSAAARANMAGTVREVLVKPGDVIGKGSVVARISE